MSSCRTKQEHGSLNDGLHCVLKKKGRLSDVQQGPSVFNNHIPALLKRTFSLPHELHLENQRKEKAWRLPQFQLWKTGGRIDHTAMSCGVWSTLKTGNVTLTVIGNSLTDRETFVANACDKWSLYVRKMGHLESWLRLHVVALFDRPW